MKEVGRCQRFHLVRRVYGSALSHFRYRCKGSEKYLTNQCLLPKIILVALVFRHILTLHNPLVVIALGNGAGIKAFIYLL